MENPIERKNTGVLLRTVVEAAEELTPKEGLELLLTYSHYALGDDIDLEKCNTLVHCILLQNIPVLNAFDRRYQKKSKPPVYLKEGESAKPKPFNKEELEQFLQEKAEENRNNPTGGESNFLNFCKLYGIPVETQVPVIVHKRGYILDFLITSKDNPKRKGTKKRKIVVEIDGEYHNTEEQKKKDERRDADLKTAGYSILRLTNKDTESKAKMVKELFRFCTDLKETTIPECLRRFD